MTPDGALFTPALEKVRDRRRCGGGEREGNLWGKDIDDMTPLSFDILLQIYT